MSVPGQPYLYYTPPPLTTESVPRVNTPASTLLIAAALQQKQQRPDKPKLPSLTDNIRLLPQPTPNGPAGHTPTQLSPTGSSFGVSGVAGGPNGPGGPNGAGVPGGLGGGPVNAAGRYMGAPPTPLYTHEKRDPPLISLPPLTPLGISPVPAGQPLYYYPRPPLAGTMPQTSPQASPIAQQVVTNRPSSMPTLPVVAVKQMVPTRSLSEPSAPGTSLTVPDFAASLQVSSPLEAGPTDVVTDFRDRNRCRCTYKGCTYKGTFLSKDYLRRHIREQHKHSRGHYCQGHNADGTTWGCRKRFNRPYQLVNHWRGQRSLKKCGVPDSELKKYGIKRK